MIASPYCVFIPGGVMQRSETVGIHGRPRGEVRNINLLLPVTVLPHHLINVTMQATLRRTLILCHDLLL